ncbi:unnamed protein product, partial [Heterosigma akashiwo]
GTGWWLLGRCSCSKKPRFIWQVATQSWFVFCTENLWICHCTSLDKCSCGTSSAGRKCYPDSPGTCRRRGCCWRTFHTERRRDATSRIWACDRFCSGTDTWSTRCTTRFC